MELERRLDYGMRSCNLKIEQICQKRPVHTKIHVQKRPTDYLDRRVGTAGDGARATIRLRYANCVKRD